jgi:hypothetical protein
LDICPFGHGSKVVAFEPRNSFFLARLGQRIEGESVLGESLVDNKACCAEAVQGAINLTHVRLGAVWSTSAKLGMELEAICGTQGQDPQECFANGHKNTLLSRALAENSL